MFKMCPVRISILYIAAVRVFTLVVLGVERAGTSSCANFIVAVKAVKYPADRQPVSLSLRLLVREVVLISK